MEESSCGERFLPDDVRNLIFLSWLESQNKSLVHENKYGIVEADDFNNGVRVYSERDLLDATNDSAEQGSGRTYLFIKKL